MHKSSPQQRKLLREIRKAPLALNKYIEHNKSITRKQWAFLLSNKPAVLFGGAAGPGKSDGILMGAAMYVDRPKYAALIMRRRLTDLRLPGGLIQRSHVWWDKFRRSGEVIWNGYDQSWTWPATGAIIQFGYAANVGDVERYQSTEFQYIGIDEAGQFVQYQLEYMWRSLRRTTESTIPLRYRLGANPGGVGHAYLKSAYVDPHPNNLDYLFIPAKLNDAPHLDRESYINSLGHLDPITKRMYLDGDWTARHTGGMFLREWFKLVQAIPEKIDKVIRYWDVAATEKKPGNDPAFTAGVLMVRSEGAFYVLDVIVCQKTPAQVDALMKQTAAIDTQRFGGKLTIYEEQEPGSSGVKVIQDRTRMLAGYSYKGDKKTESKELRAKPVSSQAEVGNLYLLEAPWNKEYLDQHEAFPQGDKKDMVDATSGAMAKLTSVPGLVEYYSRMEEKRKAAEKAGKS